MVSAGQEDSQVEKIRDLRKARSTPTSRQISQGNGRNALSSPKIGARHLGRPTVSVIIPTLNEADNLPLVLPYLPLNWIDEVILVDGRSTDGTIDVARRLLPSVRVVMEPRPGKGAAMWAGYKASSSDVLVVLDADGSHDPREIPRFVQALMQGADLVKGSRFTVGGGTTDMPRIRKLGNSAFVFLVNLLWGTTWTDLCYGYHAFWRHCLDVLDLSDVDGFEIDTALYVEAARWQLRVTEVPSFEGYRFHGVGKLKTIPDGFRVLKTIGREWWRAMKQPRRRPYLGFRGSLPITPDWETFLLPGPGVSTVLTAAEAHPLDQATDETRPKVWRRVRA